MRKFTDYLKEAADGEMTFPPDDSLREELSILVNSLGNVDKRAEEYASRLNRLD